MSTGWTPTQIRPRALVRPALAPATTAEVVLARYADFPVQDANTQMMVQPFMVNLGLY